MKKVITLIIAIVVMVMFIALVGCGGGGGSTPVVTSNEIIIAEIKATGNIGVIHDAPFEVLKSELIDKSFTVNAGGNSTNEPVYISETETSYIIDRNPSNNDIAIGLAVKLSSNGVQIQSPLPTDETNEVNEPTPIGIPSNIDGGKIIFTVIGQEPLLIDLPAYVFKSDASVNTFKFDSDFNMFVIDDGDKYKIQFGTGGLANGTHIEISPSGITGN